MPLIKSEIINHQSKIVAAHRAVTLVELTVAMAVMVVVFATVVPLLRGIHNSWDTRQGMVDLTQNGRILIDHLYKHLATAKRITSVSASTQTNGFIEFRGNDDLTYRYDISGNNYIEFGEVGSLADLAGPVSSLQFTCYNDADLADPITDGNTIRLVKVQTTMTNATPMGRGQTWTTSVQLRCDVEQEPALVGWWRFNEASGLTALDSSTYGNNGTLTNMTGDERIAGVLNKALSFDGTNDHVVLPIGSLIASMDSITVATWANFSNTGGSWQRIFDFGKNTDMYMYLTPRLGSSGAMRFGITTTSWAGESILTAPTTLPTGWHHVAVTIDGTSKTMKLFQDGVLLDTEATDVLPLDLGNTSNNWLGRSQYSADDYYRGAMDDFRLYNYVLTSTQMGDLFAVGDMIQHLPLDESSGTTAYDNVGSNNGTLNNGPMWTTGTWSGALSFDGTDDFVQTSRTIQDDMTITLWIKTTSPAAGPYGEPGQWWDGEGLADADVSGHHNDFGCSNNRGKFCYGNGHEGQDDITVQSTSSINDGTWHHLAATRNSTTGRMTVYVDGIAENSATGHDGTKDAATAMRIGGILAEGGTPDHAQYFHGQLDDVRIYRQVLTADQIRLLLE